MSELQAKPSRTVAIVGLGSRGLGVLERIVALAGPRPLTIHVIDPVCTGAGVHETSQPDYLLLNTTCGQVSMFPDWRSVGPETAAAGPSLHEWATARGLRLAADGFTVGEQGRELRPTDFLPRRLLGEYLGWFFAQLGQRLPGTIRLLLHRGTAVGLDRLPSGELDIALDDGTVVRAEDVFLTTGYTGNVQSAQGRLIAAPYPLPEVTEPVAPGETVAIGGFGLSAMDVVSCLTVGRGGRYRRDQGDLAYLPSGREPRIVLYSRSGVPCRARPLVTQFEISYDPLVFTPAAIEELRRQRGGPLDFQADLMPLVLTEMRIAYRRCQARCADAAAEQELVGELRAQEPGVVLDKLDATLGAFDAAALFDGSGGMRLSSRDGYRRWFAGTIRRDLGAGLLGFAWSPVKAALDIIRELRDTFRYAVDFGGLTGASCDDFFHRVVPLFNRAVVGPQYERHTELLALMDAGLLDVPLGPAPAIAPDGGRWRLTSTRLAEPCALEADWLLPAQVGLPDVESSASPLIAALARQGQLRRHRPGSRSVYGVDVNRDQHPLDAHGMPDERIWVLGPLCEGATFYNNLVPSPGVYSRPVADAHRCVTAMLAGHPEATAGGYGRRQTTAWTQRQPSGRRS